MMGLFKKLYEKKVVPADESSQQQKARRGRGRPKRTETDLPPNQDAKGNMDVQEPLSVWGQLKLFLGYPCVAVETLPAERNTLVEINQEYCSYKSIFSAWLPPIVTVVLCIILEGPYPFTPDFKRFANWKENWKDLVVPALTPISTVILGHFFGCLWNFMTISMPNELTRATHTLGRVLDCAMGIFIYRGLLNFLTLWELADRRLAFGCFDNDQCPVKGSGCEIIAIVLSHFVQFLQPDETTKLCKDGKSMKLGDLLVAFLLTITVLCIFFTYRLCSELNFLGTTRPPIRVTFTKGDSKKIREFSSLAEIQMSPTIIDADGDKTETITKSNTAKLLVLEPGGLVITEDVDMTESIIEKPMENGDDFRRRTRASQSRHDSRPSGSGTTPGRSKAGRWTKTRNDE